jgi:hypothetical protein
MSIFPRMLASFGVAILCSRAQEYTSRTLHSRPGVSSLLMEKMRPNELKKIHFLENKRRKNIPHAYGTRGRGEQLALLLCARRKKYGIRE